MDAERIRPLTANHTFFSLPPVLRATLRIWSPVGVLFLALGIPVAVHAASGDEAPAAAQPEGAKAGADTKTTPPAGTPAADEKAKAPEQSPGCDKITTAFDAKGPGMASLSKEQRAQLVSSHVGQQALLCLALADGQPDHCDNVLTDDAKKKCLSQFDLLHELRGLPKEKLKGHLIHKGCMEHVLCESCGKKECDDFEDAVDTGSETKCGSSPEPTRSFCTALATRDPAKCSGVPKDMRTVCEAMATEDVKRCPAGDADCKGLVNSFAVFRKQGLDGAEEVDPSLAAAATGRDACKPLLTKFEKACSEAK